MKITNLKENMILKNYKHLCEVLEIEPKKSNNSKLAQYKELERYCSYHKDGHKIIIDEIFGDVKDKMDGRVNNKGRNNVKYADDIEVLLMNLLLNSTSEQRSEGVVGYSKSYLYSRLGLVNDNYKPTSDKVLKLSDVLNVSYQAINECYNNTNNKLWSTVRSGLNSMKNKALISWECGYNMVVATVDDNDRAINIVKVADKWERDTIRDCEKKALDDMNINSKTKVFTLRRWDEFKEKVTEYLKEEYSNVIHYYESVVIHFTYDIIVKEFENMDDNDLIQVKKALNSNISTGLDKAIDTKHKSAKNKDIITAYDNYRVSEGYTQEQKNIKDTLVKRDTKVLIDFNFKPDGIKTLELKHQWLDSYSLVDTKEEFLKAEGFPMTVDSLVDDSKEFEFIDDNCIPF